MSWKIPTKYGWYLNNVTGNYFLVTTMTILRNVSWKLFRHIWYLYGVLKIGLKIDGGVLLATEHWTQKDRGKTGIWANKSNSVRLVVLVTQKIVLVLVNEKGYPNKIVFKSQNVKKESQNGSTSISTNIEGVPSPGPSLTSWASMICWETTNSALFFIDVVSIPIHVHSCEL